MLLEKRIFRIECTAVLAALLLVLALEAGGQVPFENGVAQEWFTNGVFAPTEMAFDSMGNLFVGSGYEPAWPNVGAPTPIFKILPNGTTLTFSSPISDPDALTVGPNDHVYVGSYGGIITQIDGVTEIQMIWLVDSRLENIDGLRFSPDGFLYTVASDSSKVHKIDPATKTVVEFADLASLGITGMSGIAFPPNSDHVFVASPWENIIVELDANGSIINPAVATGFLFLGFIDFDPTGKNDGYLFAPDAIGENIYRVDITTGVKTRYIDKISPGPVGLVFDAQGKLFFNVNYDQVPQGDIHHAWNMFVDVPSDPNQGDAVSAVFQSRHDEFIHFAAFLGLSDSGPTLPGGRKFPISLDFFIIINQSLLDANGEFPFDFTVPVDPSLSGVTIFFALVTYKPSPMQFLGFSAAAPMTIH